jgi:protein Mpv17
MSFIRAGIKWWTSKLSSHPYTTQILTNGPLWGAGDAASQLLIEDEFDWARCGRMALYGFAVAGPLYCWWYKYIDVLAAPMLKRGAYTYLGYKVFLDQLVFEPPYLAQFFVTHSIMETGLDPEPIKKKLKDEYLHTFAVDCAIWPAVQFINFRFVPLHLQAVYVNVVSLGWAGFLSFVNARSEKANKPAATTLPNPSAAHIAAAAATAATATATAAAKLTAESR